jgi:hypothetical protein
VTYWDSPTSTDGLAREWAKTYLVLEVVDQGCGDRPVEYQLGIEQAALLLRQIGLVLATIGQH